MKLDDIRDGGGEMKQAKSLQVEWAVENGPVEVEVRKRGGARLAEWDASGIESGRGLPQSKTLARGLSDYDRTLPLSVQRRNCMKTNQNPRRYDAFTLIEMLVVIGIIAILAGILLPALATGKTRAKVATARSEMQNIATAIAAYDTDYSRPPVPKGAENAATTAGSDFTFGIDNVVENGYPYETNNAELMVILMNENKLGNLDYARNPRKIVYFSPRLVAGDTHGLSASDGILRDPFGNPYIVTVDMNDDNKCRDAFYRQSNVSQRAPGDNVGFYGLTRAGATAPFEVNGPVAIWTFGPDRKMDGGVQANADPNKDNILSWKQ